ncbi:glucose-6-phosphate isomerase, partial [Azotobacter beijerinckii]
MSYYQQAFDVTRLPSWKALQEHRDVMQNFNMRRTFQADPERFHEFSMSCCGLFLDYSKNLVTRETRDLLVSLAREAGLAEASRA